MNFYVYRLDDPITNEFYIGSRQCECSVESDSYMGSYTHWKPDDKGRLVKTILKTNFRKRETTNKFEAKLIRENIKNPLNKNAHIPGIGFFGKERIIYHPFSTNKYMKKWCKKNDITCNTHDGSDVKWDLIDTDNPFKEKIPKTNERSGILKIFIPKYTMGKSRETAI